MHDDNHGHEAASEATLGQSRGKRLPVQRLVRFLEVEPQTHRCFLRLRLCDHVLRFQERADGRVNRPHRFKASLVLVDDPWQQRAESKREHLWWR